MSEVPAVTKTDENRLYTETSTNIESCHFEKDTLLCTDRIRFFFTKNKWKLLPK